MDSYVFKTSCGTTGYFQKDNNNCHILLAVELLPEQKSFRWSEWENYRDGPYADGLPKTTLTDPISSAISYFVWHCHEANPDIVELNKSFLDAGIYCKRINRNSPGLFDLFRKDHSTIDEVRAYNNLVDSMNAIFNVVEPDKINQNTYGHKIREVLTIACTEVEYLLLQILKDNGYKVLPRYSTQDYVKVLPLLKLDKYSVELKMHPSMGVFSPFSGWNISNPTQSLSWYSSYNATKHDRGGNFNQATLEAMINAVAAVHILLEAQYGERLFDKPMYSDYESCFQTKAFPIWNSSEVFFPILQDAEKISWPTKCDYFVLFP